MLHIFPQVNVYILGKTFLLLARELCINAPAVGKVAFYFTPVDEVVLLRNKLYNQVLW